MRRMKGGTCVRFCLTIHKWNKGGQHEFISTAGPCEENKTQLARISPPKRPSTNPIHEWNPANLERV